RETCVLGSAVRSGVARGLGGRRGLQLPARGWATGLCALGGIGPGALTTREPPVAAEGGWDVSWNKRPERGASKPAGCALVRAVRAGRNVSDGQPSGHGR